MEIRPLRWPDEIPLWAAMHTAVNPDNPYTAGMLERIYGSMLDSGFFLAFDGPEPVGYSWVARRGDSLVPVARVVVLPGHRRQGTGSALFAELSGCAAGHGHREVESHVREIHLDGLEFAEHRGFVELGRQSELELDLTAGVPPVVELPDGIEIVSWADRPDLTRALYEIDQDAVRDEPGVEDFQAEPLEQWLVTNMMSGPRLRRDAVFIALSGGGEGVGYAQLLVREAQPATAHHGFTGVKRGWRGRGIARALKATQIRWAKEAGFERLLTGNDERNAPILRLNERFGYRTHPGQVQLRGPIAS